MSIRLFQNLGVAALICFFLGMGVALFLFFRDTSVIAKIFPENSKDPEFAAALCAKSRDLVKKKDLSMAIRVAEKSVSLDDSASGCQQYLDDLRAVERVFSR